MSDASIKKKTKQTKKRQSYGEREREKEGGGERKGEQIFNLLIYFLSDLKGLSLSWAKPGP